MRARDAFAILLTALVVGLLVSARDAGAQSDPAAPGVLRPPAALESELQRVAPQRGQPLDQERVPGYGPGPHDPVFLEPATITGGDLQMGVSGWMAPGAPFDVRENPGGPAIGFTIGWPAPRRDVAPSGPNPWRGSATR
jgi:hypothetical protein